MVLLADLLVIGMTNSFRLYIKTNSSFFGKKKKIKLYSGSTRSATYELYGCEIENSQYRVGYLFVVFLNLFGLEICDMLLVLVFECGFCLFPSHSVEFDLVQII